MNITHTILATVGSIIVMFAISKLLGNKQISQLTLFDYINGITIGSIASEMAVSQEMDELIVPVIAMVLYGLTGFLLSVLTMKSIHCRHFLSGKPILLIEKGKIYPENLKTAKLDVNDLLSRARTSGYFDISKIYYAILETNGTISFMERAAEAPLTPKDLGYENTGWVEILGCGMVDPNVLESNGIDSKIYSGYALGMGIERITNLKYQVKDLRMFSENDTRFLKEFEAAY